LWTWNASAMPSFVATRCERTFSGWMIDMRSCAPIRCSASSRATAAASVA
jgi:hypothetical protein